MISSIYCVICGCPFVIPPRRDGRPAENNWSSEDPTIEESKQWLLEFRILGSPSCVEELAIPKSLPPKNESEIPGLFISGPADSFYLTYGSSIRMRGCEYRLLSEAKNSNNILFLIHSTCLDILQRALAWRAELTTSPLGLLEVYEFLCDKYTRNAITKRRMYKGVGYYRASDYMDIALALDTTFYGAGDFWTVDGWQPSRNNEWYCIDPVYIENLSDYMLDLVKNTPQNQKRAEQDSDTSIDIETSGLKATPGSLEGLPVEIISLITSFLPILDVLRLRRCSKTFMLRIRLDQSFWRTNLLKGRLVPYIWDLERLQENLDFKVRGSESKALDVCDWKSLAKTLTSRDEIVKAKEGIPSEGWGLHNRRRIWSLADVLITASEK